MKSHRNHYFAAGLAALAVAASAPAQQILVPQDHTWNHLHPMGTLPPRPDTTPDPDFDTTWYLAQSAFLANYDGPSFSTSAVGDPLILTSADSGAAVGPFAYGGVDGLTASTNLTVPATNNRYAAYFRTTFTVPAGGLIEPTIRMVCDDGGFLYLDGNLIATINMADGITDTYTSFAENATNTEVAFNFHLRTTGLQPGGSPGDVNVITAVPTLTAGEHTLAMSVHNNAATSSDLGLLLELSALDPATTTIHATVTDIVLDTNGTPSNTADDLFSFKVTLSGANTGANWTSNSSPASGSYNVATTMGPFAATGPATITFTDAGGVAFTTVTVDPPSAFTTVVPPNQTWQVMNPLAGVLPPKPAGGADADFETTWFLKESDFVTQYDGPNFGANGVGGSYQAITGPGPIATGGVDGIVAGTSPTLPASGSRRTSYYRTTFTTTDAITALRLDLVCDDGVFIYLDGNLVAQEGMPAPPAPAFTALATAAHDETASILIDLSQPPGTNVISTVNGLAPGQHTLAVSLHQNSATSSDFGFSLRMSGITAVGQPVINATASNIVRSDAGTPGAPLDDTFTFDVTVTGSNAGPNWTSDSVPGTGNYGVATSFGPFPVSGGAKTVNFASSIDPNATASVSVTPPASTMTAAVSNVVRDGAGTPADPRDDTFSFTLTANGTFLSTAWNASQGPATGTYGTPTVFGPFPTSGGNITVTLTDSLVATATATVVVAPPRYVPLVELVPYSHTWKVMNPLGGVVPDGPGGPDTDFDTTWYLAETAFNASYNGPTFGAGGVAGSYEAITGPGPFQVGGVDGIAAGTTIGPAGTTITLPASGSRYTSYYRTTFTAATDIDNLKIDILCDDGAFIYLDGVLVAQENIAQPDTYTGFAANARNESLLSTIDMTEAPGTNVVVTIPTLTAGTHTLAVSLHQSAADSSDAGLAITLYGRTSTGTTVTPSVGTVTRNFNNTLTPADDTFNFPVTVTAVNGSAGWTSNSVPASGSYGVQTAFGPFPVSDAPKSITFSDSADPLSSGTVVVNLPAIFGMKNLGGTVSPVLPALPIPANWTANPSTISHSTNVGVAAPGSVLTSEVVNLTGVSGPVQFRMNLNAADTSNGSNFEDGDTVLAELVLNDGVADQRINLITPFDTNANGVLNGFTGADVATYNAGKAADELNGAQVDAEASADFTFALGYLIPDNIVSAQVVVTVVALGGTETVTVSGVTFAPGTVEVDSDGDGQTDASEAVAGTNPNDASDYLRITGITATGAGADVTFPSKTGKNYRAEVSNRVDGGWTAFGNVIAGTGGTITASIPQVPVPGETRYFLRVRVVP